LDRGRAAEFLKLILPYLQLKRPQAEIAIKFQAGVGKSTRILTDEQLAVREAQKILLQEMKRGPIG